MAARDLVKIGEFYIAPGYSTEFLHIFLATGLQPDPLPRDVDEFIHADRIPVTQAYALAERGEIRDAKTLAALVLARSRINKSN
jgi:ADP-ribose pyrophosphatase